MGINTYAHESTTTVAPTRLFKALVLVSGNLIPKVMPDVKDIETVDGDETIKKMNFVEGGPIKYLKHKIHVVDEKNLVSKYSLVEGDVLGDKLESITYEVKFEASGNGGCVCKTTSEYHTKGDHVVTEEEHNVGKEKAIDLLKAVEAYLVANPSVYA